MIRPQKELLRRLAAFESQSQTALQLHQGVRVLDQNNCHPFKIATSSFQKIHHEIQLLFFEQIAIEVVCFFERFLQDPRNLCEAQNKELWL